MTWEHYKHIQLLSKSKNQFRVPFLSLGSISEKISLKIYITHIEFHQEIPADQRDLAEAAHVVTLVLPELLLPGPPGSQ